MNLKRIILLSFYLLVAFYGRSTPETYSRRFGSSDINSSLEFQVFDGRYNELGLGLFFDKNTRFLLKLGYEERTTHTSVFAASSLIVSVTIEELNPAGTVVSSSSKDLEINYDNTSGEIVNDLAYETMSGGHRYRVSIDGISGTVADNVYLEAELMINRFYELDETVPSINARNVDYDLPGSYLSTVIPTGGAVASGAEEVMLYWNYIEGAEEYELEWTWIDSYDVTASTKTFYIQQFERNHTRIITSNQSYKIPLIFGKGYLIYRVRAVGRWVDASMENVEHLKYGPWSTHGTDPIFVSEWTDYLEVIEEHEALKNWQYQAVYAEDGKKKEIVSYFDGSLRNRQTVTRLNSNDEAIVGETIFDNQGRPAVQVLPAPTGLPSLRYYENFNRNSSGTITNFTHFDFDWEEDGVVGCMVSSSVMNTASGASKYYSTNNSAEGNWQDYVPDAGGYPFVQTEYTRDNTGRIRKQSGVGPDHKLDGDHSTSYFYSQPEQEELDRLFGYNVGFKSHYKKNMVVDANGQVSISYIDPKGRVIATALAGTNTLESGTVTNLQSLDDESGETLHGLMTVDMLQKLNTTDPDTDYDDNQKFSTGSLGGTADALLLNRIITSEEEGTNTFTYQIETGTYSDPCMADGVAYPFAYQLKIDIVDDCGESAIGGPILEDVVGANPNGDYTSTTGVDWTVGGSIPTALNGFTATFGKSSYALEKRLVIDPDKLNEYADHYIANLSEACAMPDFFVNTVDCEDDLPAELVLEDINMTTCEIVTNQLMWDLMPGGQYGGDPGDLLSVYSLTNILGTTANFQNPSTPYLNNDGSAAKVEVVFTGDIGSPLGTDFTPEITSSGIGTLSLISGEDSYEINPEYLAQAEDFIAEMELSWVNSLLPYHPEYCYVAIYDELCSTTNASAQIDGISLSSEQYDIALTLIDDYASANSVSNPLGVKFTGGDYDNIYNIDPYSNISSYTYINSFTGANTLRLALLQEILNNYKGTSLNLWRHTVNSVLCGTDITGSCSFSSSQYSDPTTIPGITTEELNHIWNLYNSRYIYEKRKVDQFFIDMYAIDQDCYNGNIGTTTPIIPGIMTFTPYPNYVVNTTTPTLPTDLFTIYTSVISSGFPWIGGTSFYLYADKIKRFIPIDILYDSTVPDDVSMSEMEAIAEAETFQNTGRCALSYDVELLLNGLANANALTGGSSVAANDVMMFTEDIYYGLEGTIPSGATTPITISSTTSGGTIVIKCTDANTGTNTAGNITLTTPSVGGWSWANVYDFEMMYYIPGSLSGGVYSFEILAKYDNGGTNEEYVINGTTTVEIGECSYEDDACGRKSNYAQDITNLISELIGTGTSLPSLTSSLITSNVGDWYLNSELRVQLGDNPDASAATITTTGSIITLNQPDLGRTITINLGTGIPSDLELISGSTISGTIITIYYIDNAGASNTFTASLSYTSLTPNFACPCERESSFALALEELLNYLIVESPSYPLAVDDITFTDENISGFFACSDESSSITHFSNTTSGNFIISFSNCGSTCRMIFTNPNNTTLTGVFDVVVTEQNMDADPEMEFNVTAIGLDASGNLIDVELSLSTDFDCFGEIGCQQCTPFGIAPVSCNDAFDNYNTFVTAKNLLLVDDEPYPVYTEDQFCSKNLAYVTDAYIYYINTLGITSTESPYYLTIVEFSASNLNAGFNDPISPLSMEDIIDEYDAYLATEDPTEAGDAYSWSLWVDLEFLAQNNICPPPVIPFYPNLDYELPCEEYTANVDTVNAANQQAIYLANLRESFIERYIEEALSSVVEQFDREYPDKQYHYTLYYYDQAGNLVQTVPPEGVDRMDGADNTALYQERLDNSTPRPDNSTGVTDIIPNHTYQTRYGYNSLNQLSEQKTPDGGTSKFAYDELGRLVVSQNAKQLLNNQFSYTRYDGIGRIIEVGEMELVSGYTFNDNARLEKSGVLVDVSADDFPANLGADLVSQEEVTVTIYDEPLTGTATLFEDYAYDNTRNRITGVLYFENYSSGISATALTAYDNGSFYDYDVHGNVKEVLQVNKDEDLVAMNQSIKSIKYEYDLVSGNVREVIYQEDASDQFVHEYEYDADNRLTNVRTSKDKIIYEQDAKYFYYDHGPIARTEIGDKKVQAMDFAYTVQGWLKGVNSEDLEVSSDQGKDGETGGINQMNGVDAFGYSLHYFNGDYTARQGNDFLTYSESTTVTASTNNLYNGNIKEMYTAGRDLNENVLNTNHSWYTYDQLNRITSMNQEFVSGGSTPSVSAGQYESSYSFDRNGNLTTLKRWGDNGGVKTLIDDFTYVYERDLSAVYNNRLVRVNDAAGEVILGEDLANQTGTNYTYTAIGELYSDVQEEIASIEWKVTGKVRKINRTSGSTKNNLEFVYDALGNRIMKIVKDAGNNVLSKTVYVRDAQGNVMSIYEIAAAEQEMGDPPSKNLILIERNLYGSSRLGTEKVNEIIANTYNPSITWEWENVISLGDKQFELSNHLGNVLEVITDHKIMIEGSTPGVMENYHGDVIAQNDYYPFGMLLPGRNGSSDTYRYGFNGMEKDDEVKGNGNSYTTFYRQYDSRIARWTSLDPKMHKYPGHSAFSSFNNNPLFYTDPRGDDPPENFKKYTAAGGGDIYLPGDANVSLYSQLDYDNAVSTYGQKWVDDSGIKVGQVKSFSFGSTTFNNSLVSPGASGNVKSEGYRNGAGVLYKNPDIEWTGGTLETEMNLTFDVSNTGVGSSSQVVQTVTTSNQVPSATYQCANGGVGFVDGGVNSAVTTYPTNHPMYYPQGVNPGTPYYIFTASSGANTGEVVNNGGGNSSLRVYDNPTAQNVTMSTVYFQTIIVATNFYNSGVDVVMGTYDWGFNNSMTGNYVQTHTSNTVTFTVPTQESMDIIVNDYPGYQIIR